MSVAFKKRKKQHGSSERELRGRCVLRMVRNEGRTRGAPRVCRALRMWVLMSWLLGAEFPFAGFVALG